MGIYTALNFTINYIEILCRPGTFNLSYPVLVVSIKTTMNEERIELQDDTVSLNFNVPEVCQLRSILISYQLS